MPRVPALALLLSACGDPPVEDLGGLEEGCMASQCHAGVERIHLGGPALLCTDCHGGDPRSLVKETAHVTVDVSFNPSSPGSQVLDNPSLYELDSLDPEVIRFINPADYRVARDSCGTASNGGVSCHFNVVEASVLLNRATLAGQLAGGGFLAGLQDRRALYSVGNLEDPYTPESPADGDVLWLDELPGTCESAMADAVGEAWFGVFEQQCLKCHLYRDGDHVPGLYYSSGCNGCHMVTDDEARARTGDITQDTEELGHVATHRFTLLTPDSQCAHCHVSHLGRAMLVQGVREKSEAEGDAAVGGTNRGVEDPEDAVFWGEENYTRHQGLSQIYGKPYPYFVEDEDGTNDVDETPPDVHTAAGLGCIDCHNIREAHGDGAMAERMDREIDVRCETCHGKPGEEPTLVSDAGLDFNRTTTSPGNRGLPEPVFEVDDETGAIKQLGRFTGLLHNVTRITERTDPTAETFNPRTQMGCELHAGTAERRAALKQAVNDLAATYPSDVPDEFPGLVEGFTFETVDDGRDGRLECFACHNSWTVNCYGCHMVRDDRQTYTSQLDGQTKNGRVSNYGLSVVSDGLSLGINARGRITPMVGTAIFFSEIDEDGDTVIDAQPLTDGAGMRGGGNVHNPVHHHTVQRKPRDCDGCHPSVTGSSDTDALMTATGLGSGRYLFTDGDGIEHVLDKTIDADLDGDGVADNPLVFGLPEYVFGVEPAVSTTHQPVTATPGTLDETAVNGMLINRVVPQRPDER